MDIAMRSWRHQSCSGLVHTTREACCLEVNAVFAMSNPLRPPPHPPPKKVLQLNWQKQYMESNYALNVQVAYETEKLLTICLFHLKMLHTVAHVSGNWGIFLTLLYVCIYIYIYIYIHKVICIYISEHYGMNMMLGYWWHLKGIEGTIVVVPCLPKVVPCNRIKEKGIFIFTFWVGI
jgi:hypothetical protein